GADLGGDAAERVIGVDGPLRRAAVLKKGPRLLRYPPEAVIAGEDLDPAAVEPLRVAVGLPVQDVVMDREQRAVLAPVGRLRCGDHGIGIPGGAVAGVAENIAERRLRSVRVHLERLAAESVVMPVALKVVGVGIRRGLAE